MSQGCGSWDRLPLHRCDIQLTGRKDTALCGHKIECRFIAGRVFPNGVSLVIQIRRNHLGSHYYLMLNRCRRRQPRYEQLKIMATLGFHSLIFHSIQHTKARVSKKYFLQCCKKKSAKENIFKYYGKLA